MSKSSLEITRLGNWSRLKVELSWSTSKS